MKGLLFTYALTYGGAAASLFNPFYGLLIYICFAIIKPESLWHWSVPAGNYSRIVAIALLVGWALHGFGDWRLGRAKGIALAIAGFWLWAAVSTGFCEIPDRGLAFLEATGKIVLPVIVGLTLIHTSVQIRQLAWTITLSQGYVAYDLNMSYFSGFNRLQQAGFGGMDNNCVTIAMVTGVGFAFFLGLSEKQLWKKLIAFACAAFMTHAIFFSFSRGGMLALCFVGMATFVLIPKNPKLVALFAAGALLALMMAGSEVRERFFTAFADDSERDVSAQSRLDLWQGCIGLMLQHPVTGVGPDHFPLYADELGYTEGKEAHTLWLQTGAELGFPGVLCLLGFYVLTAGRLWRINRRPSHPLMLRDPFMRWLPAMVVSSLVGFGLAGQFVSLEGLELPYYITLTGAAGIKLFAGYEFQSVPALAARSQYAVWPSRHVPEHAFPKTR